MIDKAQLIGVIKKSGFEPVPTEQDFGTIFSDLGFDSLDIFNLLGEIEVEFGRSVGDEEFDGLETLEDLLGLINN